MPKGGTGWLPMYRPQYMMPMKGAPYSYGAPMMSYSYSGGAGISSVGQGGLMEFFFMRKLPPPFLVKPA